MSRTMRTLSRMRARDRFACSDSLGSISGASNGLREPSCHLAAAFGAKLAGVNSEAVAIRLHLGVIDHHRVDEVQLDIRAIEFAARFQEARPRADGWCARGPCLRSM